MPTKPINLTFFLTNEFQKGHHTLYVGNKFNNLENNTCPIEINCKINH